MNDEKFLRDLTVLSGSDCENFCNSILDGTLTVELSYEHYVYLTLILIKYLGKGF